MRGGLIPLLLAVPVLAADFTGPWDGSGSMKSGKQDFYFVFWEDGSELNGSGGPDIGQQDVIENGKINGNKISFDLPERDGTTLHFELSAAGDALTGTVARKKEKGPASGTVSLKKDKV